MGERVVVLALYFSAAVAPSVLAQHEGHEAPPPPTQHAQGGQDGQHPVQPHHGMGHHGMEEQGVFGPYPMSREASGTSWQPDSTPHAGYHFSAGRWMMMAHGFADLVYDHQGGPRGDSAAFGPTMAMLMAHRPAGHGTLGLRAMLSLDPLTVGNDGYPLLLQTGETADGREPLVDRQHPHDLFMELGAGYSRTLRQYGSVFAYFALPGEPALGPPAFMHRFSGMAIPEAPLTHHWLDSTHITFGVATVGVTWKAVRVEGSSFTGREPDQHRWGFDSPRFDSYSGRVSFNPGADWSLQVSAGHLHEPEQLEPGIDVDRYTASASYNRPLDGGANWQTTAAWGRNRKEGRALDGLLLESVWWSGRRHTLLGRAEIVEKDELFATAPLSRAAFHVGKLSLGYVYDFSVAGPFGLGVGVLGSVFRIPAALEPVYGDTPLAFMLFVRGVVR